MVCMMLFYFIKLVEFFIIYAKVIFMEKYWTDHHNHRLNQAETFEELADIAIDILSQMSKENKPIVEICGPISTGGLGNIKDNLDRFEKAIKIAEQKGMYVFRQTIFEKAMEKIAPKYPVTDGYHLDILEIFYRRVFSSGYIKIAMFLPDWESSKGARWERNIVYELGLEIREYPEDWLE